MVIKAVLRIISDIGKICTFTKHFHMLITKSELWQVIIKMFVNEKIEPMCRFFSLLAEWFCVIWNADKLQSMLLITLHLSWGGWLDLIHNGSDDYSINSLVKSWRSTVSEHDLNQARLYLHDKTIG